MSLLQQSYEQVFKDWLETVSIVNSVSELSPVTTLTDLPDVIPEHDEYRAMPHSLRHVLTPPTPNASARPRSILLEPVLSQIPSSPYSRPRWPPSSDSSSGGVSRARQSVSSIGSCSTIQTGSAAPMKSILTRHDSGISMATSTKCIRRKKKRSPPSVKFVDAPTVHYDDAVYYNAPPRSSSSPSQARKPTRWFTKWWKRSSSPPPRPPISGPYHLSHTASLVDVYTSRSPMPKPGRLKELWHRLTSMIA
ncbi:hypothetical protein J3R82DRAFT_1146 [Butyriboletus roseoflavus]|nr:hypothetical protein J3R82DRAFT_1146 [Butyriboletus roseoflavus]